MVKFDLLQLLAFMRAIEKLSETDILGEKECNLESCYKDYSLFLIFFTNGRRSSAAVIVKNRWQETASYLIPKIINTLVFWERYVKFGNNLWYREVFNFTLIKIPEKCIKQCSSIHIHYSTNGPWNCK